MVLEDTSTQSELPTDAEIEQLSESLTPEDLGETLESLPDPDPNRLDVPDRHPSYHQQFGGVKVFVGDVIAKGGAESPSDLSRAELVLEDMDHGVIVTPLHSDMRYRFLPDTHLREDLSDDKGIETNKFVIRDPFDLRE